MANISDLILQQVKKAAGNVEIPANVQNTVLNGLSDSILGSLTKTAATAGGIEIIKNLLTGKSDAATSPVTQMAGNMFNSNILSKLNLGALGTTLIALIPKVFSGLKGIIKDQDGDGDVDLNDILLTLKGGSGSILGSVLGSALGGGSSSNNASGSVLGNIAGSVLGGLFGKK